MTNLWSLPGVLDVLISPNNDQITERFGEFVAGKILKPIMHPSEDSLLTTRCVAIQAIVTNQFHITVFYATKKPNGENGTYSMWYHRCAATVAILPITTNGQVVLVREFRVLRGREAVKLPIGGENTGDILNIVKAELEDETGCQLTKNSSAILVCERFMDDGQSAEPTFFVVVDQLQCPPNHNCHHEGINAITLMPFNDWRSAAVCGNLDDVASDILALKVYFDPTTGKAIPMVTNPVTLL